MLTENQLTANRLLAGNTAHSCKASYIKRAIESLQTQDAAILQLNKEINSKQHTSDYIDGLTYALSLIDYMKK